ncbi:MAG: TIGR01777 family oxidoreductase [Verrucomicrobiota bacterium]|nr:TIGR01777 family oxidoreductase [Verrucomicrobiota bacterium]
MGLLVLEKSLELPVPVEESFAWHERPGAFERLTPPWVDARVIEQYGGIQDGAEVKIMIKKGPFKFHWVAMHQNYFRNVRFQDIQVTGPFKSWAHTHRFEPISPAKSRMTDFIGYQLPLGWLGRVVAGDMIRSDLERMFHYRHQITLSDLQTHSRYSGQARQKILISGASGLVGSSLQAFLSTGGHDVWELTRHPLQSPRHRQDKHQINWSPAEGKITPGDLEGFDTVIHLAGENIAARWTPEKMRKIRDSRVDSTRFLAQTLAHCTTKPKTLICASAIGFYGNRGEEILDEDSPAGQGFLPDVAREWEESAQIARDAGIRVVSMRLGVVLSPRGGALSKLLLPFNLGLGGRIGNGTQWMSWVSVEDVIRAFHYVMMNDAIVGPVNLTSPGPVTNTEFTHTLGKLLRRPTLLPVPAFAGKLAAGEMFDSLLLASTRAVPRKLLTAGYEFHHPTLESALRFLLGK